MTDLEALLQEWDVWSGTAEARAFRDEFEGWERCFPRFEELIAAARETMQKDDVSEHELALLGRCFELSEECEEALGEAKELLPTTRSLLVRLSRHSNWIVRWQCYDGLGDLDGDVGVLLAEGLHDTNAYARRRAFLALFRRPERITPELLQRFLSDTDSYNRLVAKQIAQETGHADLLEDNSPISKDDWAKASQESASSITPPSPRVAGGVMLRARTTAVPCTCSRCRRPPHPRCCFGLSERRADLTPATENPLPDALGHFGMFGGRYVPETLIPALDELAEAWETARRDPEFQRELDYYLREYVGRPTSLYYAARLSEHCGGARIYLKREDLCHTGSHKLNNALGQVILAKRLGKPRVIAETGAGQHGVATATACALFGLPCEVYMGEEDIERQALNVFRMRLLGTRVVPVSSGSKTLKDAINEAMRDWVTNVRTTHYVLGSVVGPHPFPALVRDLQSVIGREVAEQMREKAGRLPDAVVACVGGGSNSMGIFHPLVDTGVRLVGVEAAGHGVDTDAHSATLVAGSPGVLHGARSYLLQDDDGQVLATHSVSAGLDYPGVGPEHSYFKEQAKAEYVAATDAEALRAFQLLSQLEGIIPALESAHAVAHALKMAPEMGKDALLVVNLSGRGDKDVEQVAKILEKEGQR